MAYLIRKTKRLIIRPLRESDFEVWKLAHQSRDDSKNKWDFAPKSSTELTKSNYKKIIKAQKKRRENDTFYDLAVFNKNGELIGNVSVMEVIRGISHTAFLGYRIFNNYWRQGFGKEAVKAIIDIAFKDLKLHRLEAGIEPSNIRSIKLAKSLGMRREGLKKRSLYVRNQWVDLAMYTLTTEDLGIKFRASELMYTPRS